jgi:hypothetical protein
VTLSATEPKKEAIVAALGAQGFWMPALTIRNYDGRWRFAGGEPKDDLMKLVPAFSNEPKILPFVSLKGQIPHE